MSRLSTGIDRYETAGSPAAVVLFIMRKTLMIINPSDFIIYRAEAQRRWRIPWSAASLARPRVLREEEMRESKLKYGFYDRGRTDRHTVDAVDDPDMPCLGTE